MKPRKLSKVLGRGAEGGVYLVEGEQKVVKVDEGWRISLGPITAHIKWQTNWDEHYPKCMEAYASSLIPIIKSELKKGFLGLLSDGEYVKGGVSLEIPFVEDIESLKLRYRDLRDPEIGPKIIRELYEFVIKADTLYREKELGLDPYGGEIVADVAKALKEVILRKVEEIMPTLIKMKIQRDVFVLEGIVRNVIILDENTRDFMENISDDEVLLGFVDLGMHDYSKKGKWKSATRLVHHLMLGSLGEILIRCNDLCEGQKPLSDEELVLLKKAFNGNTMHKRFINALVNLFLPLLEESR
ncbi:hypothetical protein GF354_03190 [Candidatus Peregrinibacteria bacterium]|nr:hypothetical protein [Candidatus Peregrinibacteria bacterium]